MQTNPTLCVNFQQLKELKGLTGDFELAVLYGRLKFQVKHTKITKDGVKVIARTRRQIAAYIGRGLTVTDEKLKALARMGLINIKVGMWKGRKRMFLSCNGDYDLGINARKLEMMNKYTGSIHLSVLLAYFSYWIEVKPLHADRANWAMVSRQSCADILGVDKKTIDIYVKELADKGFIRYEVKRFFQQRQYFVTVNDDFKKKILEEYREEHEQIAEAKAEDNYFRVSDKSGVSIRVNKNHQVDIINNNTKEYANHASVVETPLVDENGIVILSKRQQNYLAEAVRRTLARCDVLTWGYETLMGHMRYALGTPKNRESGQGFAHIINRAMFLVREGRWCVPFGYFKYTDEGKSESDRLRAFEQQELSYKPKEAIERLQQQGDERVYEKDEDYGNVWAAKKIAVQLKAEDVKPTIKPKIEHAEGVRLLTAYIHKIVDEAAKEFESHEDVMAKLLGKI